MRKPNLLLLLVLWVSPLWVGAVSVGGSMPNMSLSVLGKPGTQVSLAGINAKYILIDFWASWCASCRVSMSTLSQLSRSLGAKGFKVVGINVDKDPEVAKQFLKKYPASFLQLSDPNGSAPQRFGVPKMPTSYLIGPDKKVIRVFPGYHADHLQEIKNLVK